MKAIRMIFLKHVLSKGISEILFWSILPHENVGQNATPKSALTRSKITVWLSHSKITFGANPDLRQYSSHIRKNGLLLSVIKKTSPFKSEGVSMCIRKRICNSICSSYRKSNANQRKCSFHYINKFFLCGLQWENVVYSAMRDGA